MHQKLVLLDCTVRVYTFTQRTQTTLALLHQHFVNPNDAAREGGLNGWPCCNLQRGMARCPKVLLHQQKRQTKISKEMCGVIPTTGELAITQDIALSKIHDACLYPEKGKVCIQLLSLWDKEGQSLPRVFWDIKGQAICLN